MILSQIDFKAQQLIKHLEQRCDPIISRIHVIK